MLKKDVGTSHWGREVKQLNLESQGRVWRDHGRISIGSVSVVWRASQSGLLSLLQLSNSSIPSFNDLADADLELERSSLLDRGVEHASVSQSAVVVDGHMGSWRASWASSLIVFFNLEGHLSLR